MATAVEKSVYSAVNVAERKALDIKSGDTVRVHLKIQEKGKTRLQPYEGIVISRKHGSEAGATITVRKVASGVGMEKILPIYSPNISKIEVVKRAKTRRSKLYYIREKAAKEARRKMRQLKSFVSSVAFDDSVEKVEDKPETEVAPDSETPAEVENAPESVENKEAEAPAEETPSEEEEKKEE